MIKKILRILLRVVVIFFLSTIGAVIIFRFVPIPVTPLMLIRVVEQLADGKSPRLYKTWKSSKNISKELPLAVIAAEDQSFATHWGFDVEAIQKARKYNEKMKGRKVRGASTISQQTAKNVFLWPGRSFVRKGFEVYFTALIEVLWGKKRIMEVYLNVIEVGDGIYGAEAAAKFAFGKPAAKLTSSQAALIAAVLPSPRRYSLARPSPFVRTRQQWIVVNMNNIRTDPTLSDF